MSPIQILQELKISLITQFGGDICDVILFGSQASDRASEDSDYDILILTKENITWRYKNLILDAVFDVGLKYQVLFDVHMLSQNDRDHTLKGQEPLFVNAIEKGLYV